MGLQLQKPNIYHMLISLATCLIQYARDSPEKYFSSLLVHLPLNLTEKEKQSSAQLETVNNSDHPCLVTW